MAKDIIKKVTEILNGRDRLETPAILYKWQNIFWNTSVHTTGVCPAYYPIRYNNNAWAIDKGALTYPAYWLYPQYDYVFDRLYSQHPREPEITREWRKSRYQPYQKAPLLQAMDKCKAIISAPNKYTLFVDDEEDNQYIWGKNFDGKNLVDFIFWHFKAICEDPNSLFFVVPDKPAKEQKDGKVSVKVIHVPSRRISYYSREEVIFYESDNWAWYVNGQSYLRFSRNEKGEWEQSDGRNGYYAHLFGRVPVHFAGGIWNTHGYYDSYISAAMPFCDDFVAALSDVQLVNKEASHPFIIAASNDCPDCNGIGYTQGCNTCNNDFNHCTCDVKGSNVKLKTCGSCYGSKQQSHNPADWLIVKPEQMGDDLIKIINPDIKINEFLAKYKDSIYEGIRKALQQQHIDEAQSGTAKEIDRDGEMLWYQTCSNGMWYGLIEPILKDILAIRNVSKANGVIQFNAPEYTLVAPTEFMLKTELDLLEEYKLSTESLIPDYVRQTQVEAYVDKTYGGDDVMVKSAKVINYLDPYSVTTVTHKQLLITSGVATAEEIRYSNVLPNILYKIVHKWGKERYINATFEQIQDEANKMFKAMPVPVLPNQQDVVKEII
jgi:hypothetical protein